VKNSEGGESRKEKQVLHAEAPAVDKEEEKKAGEELEKFIATHRPEGTAAGTEQQKTQPPRRSGIEKKSKDEILKEVNELLEKYAEF
jgi:hypothetical protein